MLEKKVFSPVERLLWLHDLRQEFQSLDQVQFIPSVYSAWMGAGTMGDQQKAGFSLNRSLNLERTKEGAQEGGSAGKERRLPPSLTHMSSIPVTHMVEGENY